ncbi:MAG: hypothetical protein KF760_05580 [Candidatus Eremiobacteraeota bacterium]|nr:hypothetical protein [Candidatus Eremiobacteraeota bacterium]
MSWQGFQSIWGLWFPPGWQQPERLLSAWQPGARLFSAWHGWLLVYAQPRFGAVEVCPGLAVLASGDGWSSHPRLRPTAGQLALRWHGQDWQGEKQLMDLAELWDWQSLRHFPAHQPAIVPARPLLVQAAPEPVRKILPSIPPPAPEREQLLQRLSQPAEPSKNPLLGFFDLLRSVFGSPENQRYMNKMLRLFEQKNWQEALRHAIPIGDSQSSSLQAFLGQLKPRSSLDFTSPSESGFAIGTSLHGLDLLQAVYRRALQSLLEAGRIDEAAYVQGELLADPAGAVELLEKHGRLEAAARLATLKGLPASLQVRLWFQAGRPEVAMALARRYGVQAEALQMLARQDLELANRFRAAWATDLADAGCLSRAIAVGWPVREQLEDYEFWLRAGLDSPGPGSLEALVFGLQDSGYCQRLRLPEKLQALFEDRDLLTQPRRRAILDHLASTWFETLHPLLKAWAAETARRVMRQANSPVPLGDQRILEFLINLSGDPWLRADRPSSLREMAPPIGLWSETITRQGLTPIYDALWLGDGRILLALGQAGMVVLSRGGAVSQRFALPAYQLVDGERPIIVSGANLSRFQGGKTEFWCRASLDGWCESHDGYHWLVWWGRQVYCIDLLSQEWRALHQYNLDYPPREINVSGHTAAVDAGSRLHLLHTPHLELIREEDVGSGPHLCTPSGVESLLKMGEQWRFRGQPLGLDGPSPSFRERHGFCLIEMPYAQGLQLLAFPLSHPSQQLSLKLPGADQMTVRIHGWIMLVCDNTGRVLVADMRARAWLARFYL